MGALPGSNSKLHNKYGIRIYSRRISRSQKTALFNRLLDPIPPTLSLNLAGTNVVTSWSPAWRDVVLQQNDNLTTTNWTDLPNASVSPITLPATATQGFYRLRRLTNDEMHQQFLQWLSSQP